MRTRQAGLLFVGAALAYAVAIALPAGAPGERGRVVRSPRTPRAGLLRAALAASGDTESSGSRLKATYLDGEDGSRQALGWYDPALGVDCTFAVATDGTWRCLPGGADASRFFADSSCSQRLATVPHGCAPPAYAVVREAPVCILQPSRQLFALGPAFAGPLAYWLVAGGACAAITSDNFVAFDFYTVAQEVPPSSFVRADEQVAP